MSQDTPAWPTYRRLLGKASRYWPLLAVATIGMVVEGLAGGYFIKLMEDLVNDGFVDPKPGAATRLPLVIIGLFLLRGVATFVSDYGMARTGRSVVRDLREQILGKYLRLPSSQFDTESVPGMVSRLNFDTEQVTQASANALKIIVTDSIVVLFLLGVMLSTSVKVSLAMLVIAPLIGVIVWYVGRRYRRISSRVQDGMAEMAQAAEQSLAAQQDVKVHGAQAFEGARYARIANRILHLNLKIDATKASASALVQMLAAVALAAIGWVAAREALAGRLHAGEFVALIDELQRFPGCIYVHCGAGRGRSAMVVAALLVLRGVATDAREAERQLRAIRPGVRLHAAQRATVDRCCAALSARAAPDRARDAAAR